MIGDSTQADATIYTKLASEFPDRIKHIFIRDVTNFKDPVVDESIEFLRSNKVDTPITIGSHSNDFTKSAKKHQLIK